MTTYEGDEHFPSGVGSDDAVGASPEEDSADTDFGDEFIDKLLDNEVFMDKLFDKLADRFNESIKENLEEINGAYEGLEGKVDTLSERVSKLTERIDTLTAAISVGATSAPETASTLGTGASATASEAVPSPAASAAATGGTTTPEAVPTLAGGDAGGGGSPTGHEADPGESEIRRIFRRAITPILQRMDSKREMIAKAAAAPPGLIGRAARGLVGNSGRLTSETRLLMDEYWDDVNNSITATIKRMERDPAVLRAIMAQTGEAAPPMSEMTSFIKERLEEHYETLRNVGYDIEKGMQGNTGKLYGSINHNHEKALRGFAQSSRSGSDLVGSYVNMAPSITV